ncbi:MAG: class I SAM-dependent methyltransferase [Opitutaceae bacterium]
MDWTKLDWAALDRLRDGFLHGGAAAGPYWQSESALASYDLTYGERIGWKWDQVLRELTMRGWTPPDRATVLDWGCGSGVAGRRVIAHFGPERFSALQLWDHAPVAVDYAEKRARGFLRCGPRQSRRVYCKATDRSDFCSSVTCLTSFRPTHSRRCAA